MTWNHEKAYRLCSHLIKSCHHRGRNLHQGLFHKTLWIRKLQFYSYGQILTANLLINCQNSVIYGHFVVITKKKVLWNRSRAQNVMIFQSPGRLFQEFNRKREFHLKCSHSFCVNYYEVEISWEVKQKIVLINYDGQWDQCCKTKFSIIQLL